MAKIERGKNFPGLIKLEDRNILIHWELDKNLKGTVISLKPCETDEILKKAVFAICKKYFRKHLITLWRKKIFPKTSNHLVTMKELLILHGKLLPLSDFYFYQYEWIWIFVKEILITMKEVNFLSRW